jgi:hypothetical protein
MDRTATGDGRDDGHPGGNLMLGGGGSVLVHSNAESKSVWEIAPIRYDGSSNRSLSVDSLGGVGR